MKTSIQIIFSLIIISFFSCTEVKNAKSVCDNFYSYRQTKKYDKIIQLCSPQFLEITDKKTLINILKNQDSKLGKLKSFKPKSFKIITKNNITFSKFVYRVIYAKGVMSDSLTLIKKNNTYKILYYSWHKKY